MKTTSTSLNALPQRALPKCPSNKDDCGSTPPNNPSAASENTTTSIAASAYEERARGTFDIWNSNSLGELVSREPSVQRRLLTLFLVNAQQQRDAIQVAAAQPDFSALTSLAHTLKSAARSVGAMAVGALCQQLESASCAQDLSHCQSLAQALPGAVAQAQAHIEQHLAAFDAPNSPPSS